MNGKKNTILCCLEVPDSFRPKASYALRMLLAPLGMEPAWADQKTATQCGVRYSTAPETDTSAYVSLSLSPETVSFFEHRKSLDPDHITSDTWKGRAYPVLFRGPGGEPDLIASAFYFLSGWQEYVQPARDEHGRFPFEHSIQSRMGISTVPVVDVYREILAEKLAAAGYSLQRRRWNGRDWAVCPTHDIDYIRKWRPGIIYREIFHYLIRNHRHESISERLRRFYQVVSEWTRLKDPYVGAFTRIQDEIESRDGRGTIFIKTCARDPHDVSYRLHSRHFARRIAELKKKGFEIALHPSYPAYTTLPYLEDEVKNFVAAVGSAPISVRHHYLRHQSPATPRLHHKLGFTIDSTLGFAEHEGFRHGTCLPFQIYDVEGDTPLDVWEMPLVVMESTLFNRRRLSVQAGKDVTVQIMDNCRRFGGVCVFLWHNTLWDEMDHPGWGDHFVFTLDKAAEEGAYISSLKDAFEQWQ